MRPGTYQWVLAAHLLGVIFWTGGLFAVYWLLRIHAHAPKDAHEKLTLMERSLALMMDVAAGLAIGCGLAMALHGINGINMFTAGDAGWLHVKLAAVILLVLPVHGMIRARIKKFGQGKITPVPQWQWSMLLVGIMIAVIAATTKLSTFH